MTDTYDPTDQMWEPRSKHRMLNWYHREVYLDEGVELVEQSFLLDGTHSIAKGTKLELSEHKRFAELLNGRRCSGIIKVEKGIQAFEINGNVYPNLIYLIIEEMWGDQIISRRYELLQRGWKPLSITTGFIDEEYELTMRVTDGDWPVVIEGNNGFNMLVPFDRVEQVPPGAIRKVELNFD